jgi:hypothetical protein
VRVVGEPYDYDPNEPVDLPVSVAAPEAVDGAR